MAEAEQTGSDGRAACLNFVEPRDSGRNAMRRCWTDQRWIKLWLR